MPLWMLDVDAFMQMYPGLTPADVIDMDIDCFDWLPVVRAARVKAAEWQARTDT
jgi:hypothetical protein